MKAVSSPVRNLVDEHPAKQWYTQIKQLKMTYPINVTIGYLNVCHIRNKFERLVSMINGNIDVLCFAETKLDSSFPITNFIIPGYSTPYRLDGPKVKEASGGLLIYVKEDIPTKLLNKRFRLPTDFQAIPLELNFKKSKWLLISIYRPETYKKNEFIEALSKLIDTYSDYENLIIVGDFNMEAKDAIMQQLILSYDLYSIIKKPTCLKNKNGRCIDLILTNKKYSFMNSLALENAESDHHAMIYSMLKLTYVKVPPKKITYPCFNT